MAHNKKLKTSKITSFFKHNEKEEHDDEQPSTSKSDDVGDRPVLPEVQPEESAVEGDGASEAKDDDEAYAGFDDWVSPNHPLLLPFP